jgi:hypothetical protein
VQRLPRARKLTPLVMRGLVLRIHVFRAAAKAWMAGTTSPAMTRVLQNGRRWSLLRTRHVGGNKARICSTR